VGSGVCGSAAEKQETLRVENVGEFAGHIACDPLSVSEIVVPLVLHGRLLGVLDIDSPVAARFGETDQTGVEMLCDTFLRRLEKTALGAGEFI
jgi:GAF domain-containing protein